MSSPLRKSIENPSSQSPSFEKSQRTNLQYMIESLAKQIQSTLQNTENADPKTQLSLLRVYAQYMNLYMKFEHKYFPPNVEGQHTTEKSQPNRPKEMPTKPSKKSRHQPKLSTNEAINFIQQSNQAHHQKHGRTPNQNSALLIYPSTG